MSRMHWIIQYTLISFIFLSYLSGFIVARDQSLVNQSVLGMKVKSDIAMQSEKTKKRLAQLSKASIVYQKAPQQTPTPVQSKEQQSWGKAKQIGEHTWTMEVSNDKKIGTAQELLSALNAYRQRKGAGSLSWDNNLANFAQERANLFASKGNTDTHAGFTDFINNQDGFKKVGFMSLGENSSYGYQLEAVHLIEWVYAGDAPHDNNQLNPQWTHVGIGVNGVATNFIFGGGKI